MWLVGVVIRRYRKVWHIGAPSPISAHYMELRTFYKCMCLRMASFFTSSQCESDRTDSVVQTTIDWSQLP